MNPVQPIEVLLAEDTATDAEMTLRALKKVGVINRITWVKDGEEALDYVFRNGAYAERPAVEPKLILLDLKMPKVDGIEVLRRLKQTERTRSIPVVMLTSSAEERDMIQSYQFGANSYIVKPVEFDKFVEEVSKVGFYWAIVNRLPGCE